MAVNDMVPDRRLRATGDSRGTPARGQQAATHVGVERRGEAAEQGDGGLGAALFDALDHVTGYVGALGEFSDGEAEGGADVVQGLAGGQCLTDAGQCRPV